MAAVAITAAIVAAATAFLFVRAGGDPTQDPQPPTAGAPNTPDAEAEVIAALEHLLELKDRAFDTNDVDLLNEVYVAGSPAGLRARRGMMRLIRDEVVDQGRVETEDVGLTAISKSMATLSHTGRYYPCFRSSDGTDITNSPGIVQQVSTYELRIEADRWQIWDVHLEEDRVVVQEQSSCARV